MDTLEDLQAEVIAAAASEKAAAAARQASEKPLLVLRRRLTRAQEGDEREKTSVEALLFLYYEELDRARPSLLAHDAANDRLQVALIALYAAKRAVVA